MSLQGFIQGQDTRGNIMLERDGETGAFNYNFQPALPPFKGTVILQGDINQCTGTSSFSGIMGPDTFNITLENGVVLQGQLDSPLPFSQPINGQGSWSTF